MGFCISEIPLKVPVLVTRERSHMYSEGSFRGSGSSGQVNGATFVLLTHGRTALSAALGSCPCPCFLQRIRRLKACFPIRLKQNPSNFHPWKKSMEISSVVLLNLSGLAETPGERSRSVQLVRFRSKAKRGKKWARGSLGAVLKDFVSQEQALPPVRPPSSSTGNHVVFAWPGQPHKASGFGGFSLGPLNLPSLPKAVPVIWKKVSSFLAIFDAETACIAHSFLHL